MPIKTSFQKFSTRINSFKANKKIAVVVLINIIFLSLVSYFLYSFVQKYKKSSDSFASNLILTKTELENTKKELDDLKNQDQIKINQDLKTEISDIQKTYNKAVSIYEDLIELKIKSKDTSQEDKLFAEILTLLSKKDWKKAEESLNSLSSKIKNQNTKIAVSFTIPENVPQSNTPPGAGYSRQQVTTDAGNFMVSMVGADLSSTKVIVDTASDSTCTNDCPVLPLVSYVARNGAYAGVNGSYFCPATYPTCAGKTNSFDLLLMNKNKTYFNSDNNVYSGNPGVVFGGGYIRFLGAVSEWGRDTGIDSMLSNYPLLVSGGNISFGGDDDPKKGSKGNRSFVANKGNQVFIGVVHSATVAESARVMKAMGMENALNLDDGGSTALWNGGYKVGPGRDLPNVILFVKK